MTKYDPVQQVAVSASPTREPGRGTLGRSLYTLKGSLPYYYVVLVAYTIVAFGTLIWAATGPSIAGGKRVLKTGSVHVDSFYSGLALSAFLTPAAIIIRKISKEIGHLHPFAIASKQPVRAADLDRIMDPGPLALPTIFGYSWFRGFVQTILMLAGALLVPIGTLIVTVGPYAAQTMGTAVVGIPTGARGGGSAMTMSIHMSDIGGLTSGDFFLSESTDMWKGSVISTSGFVSSTSPELGPVQTNNLTFEKGVRYDGVVTYSWNPNCEYVGDDEIQYTVQAETSAWNVNFTWPDGSINGSDVWDPTLYLWNNLANASHPIPKGGTTYIAASCAMSATVKLPEDQNGLVITNGVWISRAKCTPSLSWEVSSCTWNGTVMGNCTAAPGTNTTILDNDGLDMLSNYLTAVPWSLYNGQDYVFGIPVLQLPLNYYPASSSHQYRAPALPDYENIFGITAQALTTVSTAGYYGTAIVPTVGEPERPVYIARTYIQALVLVILITTSVAGAADIIHNLVRRLPFRKTSFLTIAAAVRGQWWDQQLYGGCVLDESELRHRNPTEVMFGADAAVLDHVGLAPHVFPVEKDKMYYGIAGYKSH